MNQMNDKHRYHPYSQTKNCNDGGQRRHKHHHHHQYSSSRHNDRLYNKSQMNFSNQQSKSIPYSYFPAQSPVPLTSNKIVPPTTLITTIPQERESWIRSVKKTKINESTEQKTQYLETMLRMPQQQKSSINCSTFDRIRFADYQTPTAMNTTENNNINNLDKNSFHLVGDINNHDEIYTVERILFDHELQSNTRKCSNQIVGGEPTLQTVVEPSPWSGFLIDNCHEEELSPLSPPFRPTPSFSSTNEESIRQNQENLSEQRVMLANEHGTADTEQRQELYHQKRLQKKLQKKKKSSIAGSAEQQIIKLAVNNKNHQESSSDWIVEYDLTRTDQISQLTDMIEKTSRTITDEDKITKINIILKKIQKQQRQLRKLRQHVMSMLDEEPKSNSTNTTRQNSQTQQELLKRFLNQPITSGCWLCSGKTYTEVAIQCNNTDEQ